jgi:restriction system protein
LATTHRCRLVGREQVHIWAGAARRHAKRRRVQPELEA